MKIEGKACLVTGGAGFIGSHLVDSLLAKGCKITVLDNLTTGKESNLFSASKNKDLNFINGSILDKDTLRSAIDGIEVVFHLACLGVRHSLIDPFENHRVNAEGTLNVLEISRTASVDRFLYCSSSEIYGTAEFVPMTESHPTKPCTIYGASKLAGENYARAYYNTYQLPVVIIRPFNTFGPRSHHEGSSGELIPKSIVRCLGGKNIIIFGDGNITRDFTFISDTVRGLIAAAECNEAVGEVLNMGSGSELSIRTVAEKIIKQIQVPTVKIDCQDVRPADVGRLFCDFKKFSLLTGWRSDISFEEGLNSTIEYFKNHPLGITKLMDEELGRNWETT